MGRSPASLRQLQAELLAGAESRNSRPRSPHTVKSYVTSVIAALNWAHLQGWLEASPKIRKIKVSKLKKMKGRPITEAEFASMLDVTPSVVGDEVAESWVHTLRGLWESALRLDELMHVSWNNPSMIQPVWQPGKLPVLQIPHALQKNATEEEIPLLPGFEALVLETPTDQRAGWVFRPISRMMNQSKREIRPTAAWVGRVISRIGKKAGIVVCPGESRTSKPAKFASAHDLRRGCAERLLDAGVPPLIITRVLRHASWETTRRHYAPGDVQKDAEILREIARRGKPET